jgi:hypothetical protein
MVPVTLVNVPSFVSVTPTVKLHEAPAANVPPEKVMVLPPGGGLIVPPQPLLGPFGEAITNPAGRVSVNCIPVSGTF